jgi:hypothetical protein
MVRELETQMDEATTVVSAHSAPDSSAGKTPSRNQKVDPSMPVRSADLEPYTGLGYLSKLFKLMAAVLLLLLLSEIVTGLIAQGTAAWCLPDFYMEAATSRSCSSTSVTTSARPAFSSAGRPFTRSRASAIPPSTWSEAPGEGPRSRPRTPGPRPQLDSSLVTTGVWGPGPGVWSVSPRWVRQLPYASHTNPS